MKLSPGPFNLSFIKSLNYLPASYVIKILTVKLVKPLLHLYGNSTIEHYYLFLAIALKVLAKAFLFGVQVGLDIGVQNPLCLGLTAFCIHFLSFLVVAIMISFSF